MENYHNNGKTTIWRCICIYYQRWWFSIVMLVFGRIWHGKSNGLTWIVHVSGLIHLSCWITSCCSISTLSLKPTQCLFLKINLVNLHPQKQTWNLKMDPWKRRFLLETIISRFHVCFRGCIFFWHLQIESTWMSRFHVTSLDSMAGLVLLITTTSQWQHDIDFLFEVH